MPVSQKLHAIPPIVIVQTSNHSTCSSGTPTPDGYGQTLPATQTLFWFHHLEGYLEYFERLTAVNGWSSSEQKAEQLALALESPARDMLSDLDTSQPKAYEQI